MATFKVLDGATEYRIEIVGKFAGPCVHEVAASWREALNVNLQRRITIDISRLSGYDNAGQAVLREMHRHGTTIAAPTPSSLVYLGEITAIRRTPATLHEAPHAKGQSAAQSLRSKAASTGN